MKKRYYFLFISILFIFSSCKDEELNEEMEAYCACIDKYKTDPEGRIECIEMMEALQEKYKQQPRKLSKLVEKTNDCW